MKHNRIVIEIIDPINTDAMTIFNKISKCKLMSWLNYKAMSNLVDWKCLGMTTYDSVDRVREVCDRELGKGKVKVYEF